MWKEDIFTDLLDILTDLFQKVKKETFVDFFCREIKFSILLKLNLCNEIKNFPLHQSNT